jgi:ATP-binding cassette, subfamily G (WHITE), member 2, SNQ2
LLTGFTFFKAKDTIQGTQNKLFVRLNSKVLTLFHWRIFLQAIFMGTILSVPLSNQLQVPFLNMRSVYEIRERPSRMYSWTAMITSLWLTELPWNILGSSLFFLCWFWTVGFSNDRAGFTYLLIGVVFPMYYTTIGMSFQLCG